MAEAFIVGAFVFLGLMVIAGVLNSALGDIYDALTYAQGGIHGPY